MKESINSGNEWSKKLADNIANEDAQLILVSAGLEEQIAEFEDPEENKCFWKNMDCRNLD